MPMVCKISDCSNQGIGFGHSDSASPFGFGQGDSAVLFGLGQSHPAAILVGLGQGDSASPFGFGHGDSATLLGFDHDDPAIPFGQFGHYSDSTIVIRPSHSDNSATIRIRPGFCQDVNMLNSNAWGGYENSCSSLSPHNVKSAHLHPKSRHSRDLFQ